MASINDVRRRISRTILGGIAALLCCTMVLSAQSPTGAPVVWEPFDALVQRLQRDKPVFARRQQDLLAARYDLANRPVDGVTMSRGKPVQGGVRVKLTARTRPGTAWRPWRRRKSRPKICGRRASYRCLIRITKRAG